MLSATAERLCRRFSLAEIQSATEDFSDTHLIGTGGFGKVYKGLVDNGQETVAIKRLASNSSQGAQEFLTEIGTLSKLRHINLVSLIGYCNEQEEMILVYEYIARGTLADHLFKLPRNSDDCSSLIWRQRLHICIGAARGLDYLHTGSSIIHRDVKSTNILLDENFTAKVSDFGLAKHLSTSSTQSHVSTIVKGSFGYLDPSYFTTGRLTRKSDTYAFGVVLLEVLSGRPAVDPRFGEDELCLIMWAQEKIRNGKAEQIVASNLRDEISEDSLKTFLRVAKKCLHHEPQKRPTMAQAVVQLEFALEQQERKAPTQKSSLLLPLNVFWNRVKPSGYRATGSTQKDHEQVDANMPPVAVPGTQEDARKDERTVDMIPSAGPATPVDKLDDEQIVNTPPVAVTAIPFHELCVITKNFDADSAVVFGWNGTVYRWLLKSGQYVAIREIGYSYQPAKEFLAQVSIASSLKHENVVQLLGYCVEDDRRFLAYEFAPKGPLDCILHRRQGAKSQTLSWSQRVKIAVGAAKGLEYIHEKAQIHGHIKSSNCLLFNDYDVAKIADFALPTDENPDPLYYYPGYSPGYTTDDELSWRTDVYDFGVVLLELLTGRRPADTMPPSGEQNLVDWARPMLRDRSKLHLFVDPFEGVYPLKAVAKIAEVAALCLQNEPKLRPDMSTVVNALLPLLDASSHSETRKEEEEKRSTRKRGEN